MDDFVFKATGTRWCISVDGGVLRKDDKTAVLGYVANFEERFSRFVETSEVNAFRNSHKGVYKVSNEFAELLEEAQKLRSITSGAYDPAVGHLLERAGYDSSYKFKGSDDVEDFELPEWKLANGTLEINGPVNFDFGGIGKGYCIDKVVELLSSLGYKHFVVDGGGDMYTTTKSDGSPWRAAIQYPGKPDMAAGVVDLKNEALGVSDSFRRSWKNWHHIVDPKLKKPITEVIGASAVAPSALYADCMTSALFLSSQDTYASAAEEYEANYIVFRSNGTSVISKGWKGELF